MTAQTTSMVRCPCCGYRTLATRGDDDICPVCYWHDDGQDDPHADEVWGGPNKDLSLSKARENFRSFGAFHQEVLIHVREPRPEEI